MSWTDVFPVLNDGQVAAYRDQATPDEEILLDDWCAVSRTLNPRSGTDLVAVSLFWKHAFGHDGELPPVTRELMMEAGKHGLISRFAPWEHYVTPLLDGARLLAERRPDAVFRVYLAADLEFLIDELVAVGCEVMLMKGSSLRHNPGAMWRFLALEETGRRVTIIDADQARDVLFAIRRTAQMAAADLGLWRVPYIGGSVRNADDPGEYRPISACQFGAIGGYPVAEMMRAFLWHTHRGSMPDQCVVGDDNGESRHLAIFATAWPTYGFDEWFLIAVMFPRLAFSGVLTLYSLNDPAANHWFALDVEYCTWANPRSELLYFDSTKWLAKLAARRAEQAWTPTARSEILEGILASPPVPAEPRISIPAPKDRMTLVVARYREDISWLTELPDDISVVLYNKGPEILGREVLARVDELISLPNQGREPDTYLHHLSRQIPVNPSDWTVFCQGDPFPHSPDFIELLRHRDQWADVQPLTGRYMEEIPPPVCVAFQQDERINGISVRTEVCSVHTLDILRWRDDLGRRFFDEYCQHHGVPNGWSISGHFLELCGLNELAEKAWRAERLRFCYGAMFAVRNTLLGKIPQEVLPQMLDLARGHFSHGYVYERLWLHLFGVPFPGEPA